MPQSLVVNMYTTCLLIREHVFSRAMYVIQMFRQVLGEVVIVLLWTHNTELVGAMEDLAVFC